MRVRKWLLLLAVFALLVAACGDDDDTSESSEATTQATTTQATTQATTTTEAMGDIQTKEDGILTVGSDIPWEPFEMYDEEGNVIGFDAGLVEEVALRLDLEVVWIATPFDTIFNQLAQGEFDVVASGTTITPEREETVNFTVPYYKAQQTLTINFDESPGITSIDDLGDGDSVAAQTGTTGLAWALENLAPNGVEVVEYPNAPDTYIALEGGQVTGVIFDEPYAVDQVAERPSLRIVQAIDTDENFGFAVDPANEALLAAFNEAMLAMLDDGTYQAIYDTWFDAPAGSVLYVAPEPEEPAAEAIGSEANPIQVLYVPSVSAEEIVVGGDILADQLNAATGLFFEVSVPTSYAATVEEICASPDNTMGFIPAQAYILANNLCGVDVELKALRFGFTEYWTQYLVPRDSDIQTFEDLAGKTWAYPDAGSTSGFIVPSGEFAANAIETGAGFEAGGHTAVVRAIYNGEAEFGTTFFSPATDLDRNVLWDNTPEGADVPADLVDSCGLNDDGEIQCGDGYIVRDARRNVREELPDVIQKVRIVTISAPIPNDTLSFGPEFPDDIQEQIVTALKDFAASDSEGFEAAFKAYSWTGLDDTNDAEFDAIRVILASIGYDLEDLG